jgi:Uncharacterized protein conserved in bacteria (DUF2059)
MKGTVAIVMVTLLMLAGCAAKKDTPELRLKLAEEVAALEVEHGAFDSALDRGANIALSASIVTLGEQLGRPTTEADKELLRGILREALAEFMTKEAWTKVESDVYARHLTASELGDLAAFYKTASGSKLLNVQSALTTEMSDAAEKLFAERRESFEKRVGEAVDKAFPEIAPGAKK